MDEFNPYAAPGAGVSPGHLANEAEEGRGVWRDGKVLVMAKPARLPSRCVKCNAPATSRLDRKLSWHSPLLYLMVIFPGLIFYVIVALIVRKTAKVAVPLCDEHRAWRSRGILIGWVVALLGLASCFAPLLGPEPALIIPVFLGIGMILFGIIFGSLRSQVVTPQKIDKTHAWLNKVCPEYLDQLPPLPYDDDDAGEAKAKRPYDDEI